MAKTKSPAKKSAPESMTGTYRYDREKGEIVLVSDKMPKVASKGSSSAPSRPCGGGGCGGSGPCQR